MQWIKRATGAFLTAILAIWLGIYATIPAAAEARVVYRYASRDGQPKIALTFDDGPHPAYTPRILDILKQYGVPATFFAVGENVEAYPEIVSRIQREGHELGNHTFHHARISEMNEAEIREEILRCKRSIEKLTKESLHYFRPPEGVCDPRLKTICEELDMTIILWSVDTRDWAHTPREEIVKNVKENTKNGSIILMHDFIGKKSPTPDALKIMLPMLRELGYDFVTVSQLLEAGKA